MAIRKFSDHRIAVRDFDGNMSVVEADEIRVCVPTAACLKFWMTCMSCLVGIGVAIFLMVYQGSESAYFKAGASLLGVSVGILIPGPAYTAILPKKAKPVRRRRRPTKRSASAPPAVGSSPSPKPSDDSTVPMKHKDEIV